MHRQPLTTLLECYIAHSPEDRSVAERILEFVATYPDCLERSCAPGHITASNWILSADGERVLLTLHRKLGRWLQLGGHVDGEPHVERAALREAREESGLADFELVRRRGEIVPLDLDVHSIPAHRGEPEHDHLDVRFLLIANGSEQVAISDESIDLRWIPVAEVEDYTDEESVLRLARKARVWLNGEAQR